jgi:hypothetical protein
MIRVLQPVGALGEGVVSMPEDREVHVRELALEGLAVALGEFRITARIVGHDTVTALDRGGLSQSVVLRPQDGRLMWCWLWPGLDDGDAETEPMVSVDRIDEAARRIHNVISLTVDRAR